MVFAENSGWIVALKEIMLSRSRDCLRNTKVSTL